MAVDRLQAIINEELNLRIEFRNTINGLYDPFSISKVEILDSDQVTILQTLTGAEIIKDDMGEYHIITDSSWNDTKRNIYDKWYYTPVDGASEKTFILNTFVDEPIIAKEDFRKGFAFNNPDLQSNNGFGQVITPDELRYVYAFGNRLIAGSTGETIPDSVLKWYIDKAVYNVEKDLNYKIIKQYIYTDYRVGTKKRTELEPTSTDYLDPAVLEEQNYIWDDPYDFDYHLFKRFLRVKLRYFPILSIEKMFFKDPTGKTIYDLTSKIRQNRFTDGSVEVFPSVLYSFYTSPVLFDPRFWGYLVNDTFPDGWLVDYVVGFENVKEFKTRNYELFDIIGKLAAINLLSDYGDGKTSALASSSVSLSGISESLSTTLSATSAAFGARQKQYINDLKIFYNKNRFKYGNGRNLLMGAV